MEENYFIYYYFPKYDYCISNIYSATTKEFFDNFYSQTDDFTYSGWLNNLQSVSYGTSKVTEDNTGEKYIDFMFSSKAEQNLSRSDYCCVIRLAYSKIDSILSHYLSLKTGNVYILDRNNNQIYSNISYDDITLSDYNVYRKNTRIQERHTLYMTKTFSSNSWIMVLAIPNSNITKELVPLRLVILLVIFITTLLSFILAIIFANTYATPIKKLIKLIPGNDDLSDFDKLDKIMTLFKEQKTMIQSTKYSNDVLKRDNFLSALLTNHLEKYVPLEKSLNEFNIHFTSNIFCVIVFYIKDDDILFDDNETSADHIERKKTVSFIVKNVFEELASQNHTAYVFDYCDIITAIVNINTQNFQTWKEDISDSINKLYSFVEKQFNFTFIAGMSNQHNDISSLNIAFDEATSTLDYRAQIRNNNLISYTALSQSNKENNDYLANAIMTGDFSIAKNLLATMKSNMQSESNDNVFNILTQVLSAFYSLNSRLDKNSYEKLTSMTLNLMNLAGSIEPQQISDLVENACEICKNNTINTTESPSPPNIILKIKIYIEENYKNENLNVSSVGDYFDVTPYYLSSLFKKSEGQSILEFITKTRIEHSLPLLKSGMTVANTAKEVGYSSVHSFIRQFTKHMGCSPTQYKSTAE